MRLRHPLSTSCLDPAGRGRPSGKGHITQRVDGILAINIDGNVLVYFEVDLGTGVRTALTQMVAPSRQTDTFEKRSSQHIAIVVPNSKMKWDEGNSTAHRTIFIGNAGQAYAI